MATINATAVTLLDYAKRLGPDHKIAAVIELLGQTNEVLDDMLWVEGNLVTGHRITQRTALPGATWRKLNEGVAPTKSRTQQIDEATGMLETYGEVDKDIAELNGNTAAFRLSEAQAHIEAMNQEFVGTLFNGNQTADPEEFTGFAPRYNSLSGEIAENVLDGGGSGSDNSSIYLIGWAEDKICGIYPKGSMAGLQHKDLGIQVVQGATGVGGSKLQAYLDHWQWKAGLAVKDWRYAVRIANLDISNLVAKTSAADLIELMIKATHRIPNLSAVKPAFYMNRTTFQMLDIQRRDDVQSGGGLMYDVVDGKRIPMFRGIPVKLADQLTEAESAVS
jgi:hypothetical protein